MLPIEHVVAMDGIAIVVHPSNPRREADDRADPRHLHRQDRNWKELGGPDQPIVVISRDTNSGTYETLRDAGDEQGEDGRARSSTSAATAPSASG